MPMGSTTQSPPPFEPLAANEGIGGFSSW